MRTKKIVRVVSILTMMVLLLTVMASCNLLNALSSAGVKDGADCVDGKSAYELAVENAMKARLNSGLIFS